MYISTRGNEKVTSSMAIINGLAKDGGLYFPTEIPSIDFNENWINYSYKKMSFIIMRSFLDDFDDDEITEIIEKAYSDSNFNKEIVSFKDFDKFAFLGLYNGPTFAFKDMALTVLPLLMEKALQKNGNTKRTVILTATSGDTGSAAMSGFNKTETIKTITLYPNEGISEFQEKQIHSLTVNGSKAASVNGNFDDCQRIVKKIFSEYNGNEINLASANSINIGRLIPQIVYYFYSYIESVRNERIKFGDKINVCVPTGNFGNILACYLAKLCGAPIDKILCASNSNNVLTDLFNTGIYDKNRKFYKTSSPSMDILVSSNLERYIYMLSGKDSEKTKKLMEELSAKGKYTLPDYMKAKIKDFYAGYVTEDETKNGIKDVFDNYNFLIDPHTAVAYMTYKKLDICDNYTVIASTASPYKFARTYGDILGISETNIFENIRKLSTITGNPLDERILKLEEVKVDRDVISVEDADGYIKKMVGIE